MNQFFSLSLLCTLLCISQTGFAQSQRKADQIKYHLILDNSGSVGLLDSQKNLQSMLSRFSYLEGLFDESKISTAPKVSMDFWVYGEEVNEFKTDDKNSPYSISISDDAYEKAYTDLEEVLKSEISRNRKVMFSELHKALETVLLQVKEEEKAIEKDRNRAKYIPSQGVIIFTDGVLRGADFSKKESRKAYNQRILKLVTELEVIHQVPVFFVVTSPGPKIIDFMNVLQYELPSVKEEQTYYVSNKLFWINASTPFIKQKEDSELVIAFDKFHKKVNRSIMTQGEAQLQEGDKIQMAMLVQELLLFDSAYTQTVDINKVINQPGIELVKDQSNIDQLVKAQMADLTNRLVSLYPNDKSKQDLERNSLDLKLKSQANAAQGYEYFFRLNQLIGQLGSPNENVDYFQIAHNLDFISKSPEVLYELVNQIKKRLAADNLNNTLDQKPVSAGGGQNNNRDIPQEIPEIPEQQPDGGTFLPFSNTRPTSYTTKNQGSFNNLRSTDPEQSEYEKAKALSLKFIDAFEEIEAFDVGTDVSETNRNLESDIIVGFSDYLIERVKMETIVSFFEILKEDLEKSQIDQLFPGSWRLLENSDNYTDYATIHLAFKSDLENLPKSLVKLEGVLKENATFMGAYYTYFLIQGLIDHGDFKQALIDLKEHRVFDKVDYSKLPEAQKSAYVSEQHILFISELIQIPEQHDLTILLTGNDFKQLESLAKLILSLALVDGKEYDELAIELSAQGNEILKAVNKFYRYYKVIRDDIEKLKSLASKDPQSDFDQFRKYRFNLLLNILERSADLLIDSEEMFGEIIKQKDKQTDLGEIIHNLKVAKEFYFEIKKKNYEKAVFLILPYLDSMARRNFKPELLAELQPMIKENKTALRRYLRNQKLTLNFYELAHQDFLDQLKDFEYAAASDAKAKKAAEKALENAIGELKVKLVYIKKDQVYRVEEDDIKELEVFFEKIRTLDYKALKSDFLKRQKLKWNQRLKNANIQRMLQVKVSPEFNSNKISQFISVAGKVANANSSEDVKNVLSRTALPVASYKLKRRAAKTIMVTAYVGAGFVHYINDEGVDPAITAPVGLEYTINHRRNHSISFMATIFDVGNVIDYRVNADDENEESFNFDDILSPGLVLSYGFSAKVPLSVNAGYMFNPERLMVSLNFDLPLFRIWASQ